MSHSTDKIFVIGAGIIGVSTALELQRRGLSVRLMDRKHVAAEASQGNAGAFAFSDIVPLATPGIMRKAPKWLLDPLGPLSIPPAYALQIVPWMLRFWRASWPDRYQAAITAQSSLMGHCQAALERQVATADAEPLLQREGQLQLYDSAAALRSDQKLWKIRKDHGIPFELLTSAAEIAALQPGIATRFTHAAFVPSWINTVDPKRWTETLADLFRAQGGVIETATVQALSHSDCHVNIHTDAGLIEASKVIVACGAWSHHLAKSIGDVIPLETERGYNTTLPVGAFDLKTHLTFGGHGFVVTKINGGVRIGGAVELGGLSLPPTYKRADVLLNKAKQFLPELNTQNGQQWMGFRPSLPDSLPVIGPSGKADRVIYAFGHGHLGLTQSAGTAELVADIVTAQPSPISLTPFAPTRF